jgi:hypothetical protein
MWKKQASEESDEAVETIAQNPERIRERRAKKKRKDGNPPIPLFFDPRNARNPDAIENGDET